MTGKEAAAKTVAYILMAVASSFLISASFPPLDLGFLAWFGLTPLLFALQQRRLLGGAFLGFIYGTFFGYSAFHWTNHIISINLSNYLVMLFIFALHFSAFGLLYCFASRRVRPWMIIVAPALWAGMEYARSNLSFLAMPWNLLGHSQYCYLPLIQIADITGVYGITFLIVMVNQFLSQVPGILSEKKRTGKMRLLEVPRAGYWI